MATLATTEELITRREPDHTVRVEPCAKWVRAMHNGQFIADSKRALLMFETRHLPVYYFPRDDVSMDLMTTHRPNHPVPLQGRRRVPHP